MRLYLDLEDGVDMSMDGYSKLGNEKNTEITQEHHGNRTSLHYE